MKRKINKLLSIVLSVMLAFSCCVVIPFTATAESVIPTATYYVSPNGDDTADGITPETPLKTVNQAIILAKSVDADGDGNKDYGAGTIVAVKLIHVADTPNFWKGDGTVSGTLEAHDFTLYISSVSDKAILGTNVGFTLGGPTRFSNVRIDASSSDTYPTIDFNGKDVYLASDVTYNNTVFNAHIAKSGTLNHDVNFYLASALSKRVHLGGDWGSPTYEGDLNITVNCAASPEFTFGPNNGNGEPHYPKFKANVNFDIKKANAVTINTRKGWYFYPGAAVQVINSAGLNVTAYKDLFAAFVDNATEPAAVPYYILDNKNTEYKHALSFTETAGVFNVAENYSVVATKVVADGETATVVSSAAKEGSQQVVLDLTEAGIGVYNLSITKQPETKVVYVDTANGSKDYDGLTPETAVDTIANAMTNAYTSGYVTDVDVLNIKTIGATAKCGTLANHKYKLIIESNDTANLTTINDSYFKAFGKVELKNIKFALNSDMYGFQIGGNAEIVDLTIGQNVSITGSYKFQLNQGSKTYNVPINLYLGSTVPNSSVWLGGEYGNVTFNKDINVVVDNTGSNTLQLGLANGGQKSTYNKNVNFNIKNASSFTIGASIKNVFGEDAAIQIINSANVDLTSTKTNITKYVKTDGTAANVPTYIINNNLGDNEAIGFTETAGLYTLKEFDHNKWQIDVINSSGETVLTDVQGSFNLSSLGAGEYTVEKISKKAVTVTYFVAPNGSDSNNGKTEETAFKTLNAAIEYANTIGYGEGDTVNLKVIHIADNVTLWGESTATVAAHEFYLNISSASSRATIGKTGMGIKINGPISFENVILNTNGSSGYTDFDMNGQDITFGKNVLFIGYHWNPYLRYTGGDYNEEINIYLKSAITQSSGGGVKLFFLGSHYGWPTFKQDINITVDNNRVNTICIGGQSNGSTFQKNLNFVLTENAGGLTLSKYKPSFQQGSAVQILNHSGTDISDAAELVAGLGTDYYVVNDNSGREGVVSLTDVAGTYSLANLRDGEVVRAYKDGETAYVESVGNSITLSESGVYSFVIYRAPITIRYTADSSTTIASLIDKAINEDYAIAGDTLIITATGTEEIGYGTPTEHLFDVEIVSSEETKPIIAFYGTGNTNVLAGDTKFDGVTLKGPGGYQAFYFDGKDIEITANCGISEIYYMSLARYSGNPEYTSQNIILGTGTGSLYMSGEYAHPYYSEDVNIVINNSNYNPTINFGKFNSATFNGRVNINLNNSKNVSFAKDYSGKNNFNGGLNIISEFTLPDSRINFLKDSTKFNGDVYALENRTGTTGILGFGEKSGEFTVNSSEKIRVKAIKAKGYKEAANGVVDLTSVSTGCYFAGIAHDYKGYESDYAEYIDYRDALNGNKPLNNFAAKVNNGDEVNIVYFGGSVTAGAGVDDATKYSWRGIISSWLEINAPKASVTNINSAVGGTGTWFGLHRMKSAVLDNAPDLLFIEFSINDFYNQLSYEQAAQNLESMINWVRASYPDCDIVVLHTTENSKIQALIDNDTLHNQAQAHYDIAAAYGIPTIRLGQSLADELQRVATENGDTWSDHWDEYVSDIVHPNENGYAVYASVVREFMANSLLADDATCGAVVDHKLPSSIVSDSLLVGNLPEGNISFIPADAALSEQSASLGGDSFEITNSSNVKDYSSHITFTNTTQTLKFKFTGTDLLVVEEQWDEGYTGVYVSIDGGEEQFVTYDGKRSTAIATGLSNTEHTASIRVGGGESGWEWIYGFYVRNDGQSIKAYYVSETGSDETGDGTKANPYNTVNKVVTDANTMYGAGDTVYVKATGAVTWNTVLAYDYTLSIVSADSSNKASLTVDSDNGNGWNDVSGDYVLDDIKLSNTGVYPLLGNNVTFGEGLETANNLKVSLSWQGKTVADSQTFTVNNAFNGDIIMGSHNYGSIKWNDDVNIIVNNENAVVKIDFHSGYGGNNTYNGNVNFIFNKVNNVSVSHASSGNASVQGTYTQTANGAVNVIIPNTASITDDSIAKITGWNAEKNYYVVVDEADSGIFGFAKEAGTLTANIAAGDMVLAENLETDVTEYFSEDVLLTSGKWELDIIKAIGTTFTENFDNKTVDDLNDWTANAAIENNRLTLTESLVYGNAISKNQYISADIKGSDLANGFQIRARINAADNSEYYSLSIKNNAIEITKAQTTLSTTAFTFDSTKLYHISFSVVNAKGKAVLKAYVHDYSNAINTVKLNANDTDALSGRGFGFFTNDSGVEIDNAYFSTTTFRKNDYSWVENDINGDRDFDICDLVFADENKAGLDMSIFATANKNQDDAIDDDDLRSIGKLLLGIG